MDWEREDTEINVEFKNQVIKLYHDLSTLYKGEISYCINTADNFWSSNFTYYSGSIYIFITEFGISLNLLYFSNNMTTIIIHTLEGEVLASFRISHKEYNISLFLKKVLIGFSKC